MFIKSILKLFELIFIILLAFGIFLVVPQIKDIIQKHQFNLLVEYNPNKAIISLANEATMTDYAKKIFYSTNPEIDSDRSIFNKNCSSPVSTNSVELGCYTSDNRIFLLKIDNSKLNVEMIVTASHEMLHAAYAQLSNSDKFKINSEVETEVPLVTNKNLAIELKKYNITEPGERDNELHSILGTEYTPLNIYFENYYKQYFNSRLVVVGYANQFNLVFDQLKSTLSQELSEIKSIRLEMIKDLNNHNISGYNSLVLKMNSIIENYNQNVINYNDLSRSLLGQETSATST